MEYIQDIIDKIHHVVKKHKIADGTYARWLWQNEAGNRELGVNPYGCADAANILYSIGAFPGDPVERKEWINTLQAMQDPETGLFHESTHHPIHTTAHCAAALELFDAPPLYPVNALAYTLEEEKLEEFLDSIDWKVNPWTDSHRGAGIYVSMNLSGLATPAWNRRYFRWFWDNADPITGMWRKGYAGDPSTCRSFIHMAGTFHYLFNHEYAHMPLRYPEKLIDTCIEMYDRDHVRKDFGRHADFLEIDWIFCLTRASRQTPYRFEDVRSRLRDFTAGYIDFWRTADWEKDETINDLHMLFGGVCALAELQQTLRGELITDKPLKLVLDRRPFI